ncbi:MAG: YMGG-like glycine zipper-containing protein [Salinarimonas sp.]
MKKILGLTAAAALAFSVAACQTPGERAAGGALIGGGAGAAIGAAAGGGRGALIGGAIGAASGAMIGAATAPSDGNCPRGYYLARDGLCYPR